MLKLNVAFGGILMFLLCYSNSCYTQNKRIGRPLDTTITYNLYEGSIIGELPFDVPFYLKGDAPKSVKEIEVFYIPKWRLHTKKTNDSKIVDNLNSPNGNFEYNTTYKDSYTLRENGNFSIKTASDDKWGYSKWTRKNSLLITDPNKPCKFILPIDALKPNRNYVFLTRITYEITEDSLSEKLIEMFQSRISGSLKDAEGKTFDPYAEVKFSNGKFQFEGIPSYAEMIINAQDETGFQGKLEKDFAALTDDQNKVYTAVTNLFIEYVDFHYELKLEADTLKAELKEAISLDDLKMALAQQKALLIKRVEIGKNAEKKILEQNPEIRNALELAKNKAGVDIFDQLKIFELDGPQKESYQTGECNLINGRCGTKLELIENPNLIDTLIANVSLIINKTEALKKIISSTLSGENALKFLEPKVYADISKKIEEAKDDATRKPFTERKNSLILQHEGIVSTFIGKYSSFINYLKTAIIGDLYTYKNLLIKNNNFWDKELDELYLKVYSKDGLKASFQKTTTADFMTRAEYYISGDFGLAFMNIPEPSIQGKESIKSIEPYLGVNFNLFPINRQAHYSLFSSKISGRFWLSNVIRGSSIVLGVTQNNVNENIYGTTNVIKGLWGTDKTMLLTGVSVRLSDFTRLTLGSSWYRYKYSYSPFISEEYRLGSSLYFSFSLDLDVKKYVEVLGPRIFPTLFNDSEEEKKQAVQN